VQQNILVAFARGGAMLWATLLRLCRLICGGGSAPPTVAVVFPGCALAWVCPSELLGQRRHHVRSPQVKSSFTAGQSHRRTSGGQAEANEQGPFDQAVPRHSKSKPRQSLKLPTPASPARLDEYDMSRSPDSPRPRDRHRSAARRREQVFPDAAQQTSNHPCSLVLPGPR